MKQIRLQNIYQRMPGHLGTLDNTIYIQKVRTFFCQIRWHEVKSEFI